MTARDAFRLLAFALIGGAGASTACQSTGTPLGGPYGGDGYRLAPTDGGFLNVDATFSVPVPPSMPGAVAGLPGTWTHIFGAYLADGTVGNCTHCHAQMGNAAMSYKWLTDEGYIGGGFPALSGQSDSCLTWYGGDMPPGTPPPADDAKAEMDTWAAAGARNN